VRFAVITAILTALLGLATQGDTWAKRRRAPAIAPLTPQGLPNVRSVSAIAFDPASGEIIYGKNPDVLRYIASTTKIFVAMVAVNRGINLENLTEITKEDAEYARGGARTRLTVGHKFRNVDLLRAMLIASDNRAPTAIGRAVGLTPDQLVAEMNKLAHTMKLKRTKFTDPSGLNGNQSTAREMARALTRALRNSTLAEIMTTRTATIRSEAARPRVINYRNTNRPLHSGRYEVLGGKTGFTDEAGYCLVIQAKLAGRVLSMAFMGAHEKLTRFGDFGRVAAWIESRAQAAQ
jgi:D-alanyl-D-alanine endopeptidase (penicillin-binding protein 7)